MKSIPNLAALILCLALASCGGGGGSAGTTSGGTAAVNTTTTTTATTDTTATTTTAPAADPNSAVATIALSASSTTLLANGSSQVTFSIYALTNGNGSVAGATIALAATNGVILSSPTVVTTSAGASITMTALASDQTNRVSVLSATCSGCTASPSTFSVNVLGGSIALNNSGISNLIVGGSASSLSATLKDVGGNPISGANISFAVTDASILGLSASSAITNSSGVATVTVAGLALGNASVNVSALGNAKSQSYSSALAAGALAVTSPASNAAIVTNIAQPISVSAPGAATVIFTSTQGAFGNGLKSQTVAVVGGVASASLTASQGGTIAISVNDNLLRVASLTLVATPPVSSVNKILLNASPTTVPVSTVSNSSSITLSARAIFNSGGTDQAVANVPVEFSLTGGPGAGEFLSPALAFTNSSGIATATFTAGTAASVPNGIVVSASVQGTAVRTGVSPSNNSAELTIGGQALSVAFGPATVLQESSDKTLYTQAYSVQVTDANNNPVASQAVTLRLQPVAFSVGSSCMITATYCSEDANGNGSRDAGEDGVRKVTSEITTGSCSATADTAGGLSTLDSILTPQNSDGGSVPSSVVTNAAGTASFSFTYLKGSAFWIVNRLTATVSSNGTETSRSTVFRLAALAADVTPVCLLPPSPYSF